MQDNVVGLRINGSDIEDKQSQSDMFSALMRRPEEYQPMSRKLDGLVRKIMLFACGISEYQRLKNQSGISQVVNG